MPRKYQTVFSRFVRGHIKAHTFRSGTEDILGRPLVLFQADLPCPHLDLFGFGEVRGPSKPSSVFGIPRIFWIHGDCLALLENLGLLTTIIDNTMGIEKECAGLRTAQR
ncbi:hypothetical protein TNCV_4623841 [Trichonephila clavipes]|nr:hypothetical protein TNCV_4623841 [Trichonephila clavipes]